MSDPIVQYEGPVGSCVIHGIELSWTNCTPCSFAMGVDAVTSFAPTPCHVRALTGDTSGGTMVSQNATAVLGAYGVKVEVKVGSNVAPTSYVTSRLHDGHPIAVQGNASALIGTAFRCTDGPVNHCVLLLRGKGWTIVNGFWRPTHGLVYDPAADGRKVGWGTAATSPDWWPWDLVMKFAAALRPWGDNDSRLLGSNKWYCGIFPQIPSGSAPHFQGTTIHRTSLWNDTTKQWVYNGANEVNVGVHLEVRGARYVKGAVSCYPITTGSWATRYGGGNYYVPAANVKLGGLA